MYVRIASMQLLATIATPQTILCYKCSNKCKEITVKQYSTLIIQLAFVISYITYVATLCFLLLVGYLVGLGDRHIQNILIDQNTAEFIHIDFGK